MTLSDSPHERTTLAATLKRQFREAFAGIDLRPGKSPLLWLDARALSTFFVTPPSRPLALNIFGVSNKNFDKVLRAISTIRPSDLTLEARKATTVPLESLVKMNANRLRRLTIENIEVRSSALAEILKCPLLSFLELSATRTTNKDIPEPHFFARAKSLTTFNTADNPCGDALIAALTDSGLLAQLRSLGVSDAQLREPGVLAHLLSIKALKCLALNGNPKLADQISDQPRESWSHLNDLAFARNSLRLDSAHPFWSGNFHSLSNLYLGDNPLEDDGLAKLLQNPATRKLSSFILSYTALGDDFCALLASSKLFRRLGYIDFSWTRITERGAAELLHALPNSRCSDLDLSGCDLERLRARDIGLSLRTSRLKTLFLDESAVPETSARLIRKQLPGVYVVT